MSKSTKPSKEDQKNLEEKLGEVLGLERACSKSSNRIKFYEIVRVKFKKRGNRYER